MVTLPQSSVNTVKRYYKLTSHKKSSLPKWKDNLVFNFAQELLKSVSACWIKFIPVIQSGAIWFEHYIELFFATQPAFLSNGVEHWSSVHNSPGYFVTNSLFFQFPYVGAECWGMSVLYMSKVWVVFVESFLKGAPCQSSVGFSTASCSHRGSVDHTCC